MRPIAPSLPDGLHYLSDRVFDPASLLSRWTQADRLLQLHTPLDAYYGLETLLAESFEGIEGMEADASQSGPENAVCGFRLHITALSLNAHIGLKRLIGRTVLLSLLTAHSRIERRPFHGHVTAFECVGANGGMARYRLTVEPWLAFLRYRQDSRIFQDMTVLEIAETVFRNYVGQGHLAPSWRIAVADASIYPKRSLTTQFEESDLAFVERLLAEEGLFTWFEHAGHPADPGFGCHTLVIADYNGAFAPNRQADIAFTQSGAVMKNDVIDRWQSTRRWGINGVQLESWDYRTVSMRPVDAAAKQIEGIDAHRLVWHDVPGVYAYPTSAQGERRAVHRMQAINARSKLFEARGTVRTAAPGTSFRLVGHAEHDRETDNDGRTFVMVRVAHRAHNNLHAELEASALELLGPYEVPAPGSGTGSESPGMQDDQLQWPAHLKFASGEGERPLYRNRIDAIRLAVPWRPAVTDQHGRPLRPKPKVSGQQTAIVVGSGGPVHTDRDHRIQVQFHWQRGVRSHSRLDHPFPDGHSGAPATAATGTWVRVAATLAPIAGDNWGSHAIPRVGQEVLVDFLEGDIDRPVVIGALYNGRGQPDSQANAVGRGPGAATANAPAWFPGQEKGHAHAMVFSGLRSQQLSFSQTGQGGLNQLIFDDTPGESRIALLQHAKPFDGTAELNLGHLRHQVDNQRLDTVGYGIELATRHSASVRAGSGLLVSTDCRPGGVSTQMDCREAQRQMQESSELQNSLASAAQHHGAALPGEGAAAELPAIRQLALCRESMDKAASGHDGSTATAFGAPHLQFSAPAGIAATTPAHTVVSVGATLGITAGHAINFAAQGASHILAKDGIALFTTGTVPASSAPNQETGIALHAATGAVRVQSQSSTLTLTARHAIAVASTEASITVSAPEHVLMTSGGAYLKLEGGNIEIHGPGTMAFRAGMTEFAGPVSVAMQTPILPKCTLEVSADKPLFSQRFDFSHLAGNHELGFSSEDQPFRAFDRQGRLIDSGRTNGEGITPRILTNEETELILLVGEGEWQVEEYIETDDESDTAGEPGDD